MDNERAENEPEGHKAVMFYDESGKDGGACFGSAMVKLGEGGALKREIQALGFDFVLRGDHYVKVASKAAEDDAKA